MKSVMISIKPRWCELIASGKKTIEVRKTRPKCDTPFKCYIYCTNAAPYLVYGDRFDGGSFVSGYYTTLGYSREEADRIWGVMNGKVIGEFVCDIVIFWDEDCPPPFKLSDACLSYPDIRKYSPNGNLYGWHISDLIIYDKPRELSEFSKCTAKVLIKDGFIYKTLNKELKDIFKLKRPPQSWCYVKEVG